MPSKLWMSAFVLGLALLLGGCTTREFQHLEQGSPFSGANEPDRINIWPVYYQDSAAASAAWPLVKVAKDSWAVRPLVSVRHDRDPDAGHWEYAFVWPLSCVDGRYGEGRILNAYWEDHGGFFCFFPLYWAKGSPLSGNGYNAFFPLYIYSTGGQCSDLWLFFPLFYGSQMGHPGSHGQAGLLYWWGPQHRVLFPIYWHGPGYHGVLPLYFYFSKGNGYDLWTLPPLFRSTRDAPGAIWNGHVAVFYGRYGSAEDHLSFWTFPLGWGRTKPGYQLNTTVPLYWWHRTSSSELFLSLLYCQSRDDQAKTRSWTVPPLIAQHQEDDVSGDRRTVAGPFYYAENTKSGASSHALFPFYYRGSGSEFYTTLFGWKSTPDSHYSYWLTPIFSGYDRQKEQTQSWFVPFYWYWSQPSAKASWLWYLPLGYSWSDRYRTYRGFLPLYCAAEKGEGGWSWNPLTGYCEETSSTLRRFPLFGLSGFVWKRDPKTNAWDLDTHYVLPLYGKSSSGFYSLLYGQDEEADGRWSYLAPFYVNVPGGFYTLLYGQKRSASSRTTFVTPLVGWTSVKEDENTWRTSDTWTLPLFWHHRDRRESSTWIVPWWIWTSSAQKNEHFLFPLYSWESRPGRDLTNYEFSCLVRMLAFYRQKERDGEAYRDYSFLSPLVFWHDNDKCTSDTILLSYLLWYKTRRYEWDGKGSERQLSASHTGFLTPLIWNSEYSRSKLPEGRLSENRKGRLLCGLFWSHDVLEETNAAGAVTPKESSYRLFYAFWRSDTRDGRRSVDVFPWISYDRKKDGSSTSSWMWRFWRKETGADGETKKLYFLFIPWVDKGE